MPRLLEKSANPVSVLDGATKDRPQATLPQGEPVFDPAGLFQ